MGQKKTKQDKLREVMKPFVSPLPTKDIGKKYTKSELIQDLDFMVKTMEEVHPDLYFYFEKNRAISLLEEVKQSLHDGFDRIDFYTQAARFVRNFSDGHTSVYTPSEEYSKYRDASGLLLPFNVDCSSGEIVILKSFSKEHHSSHGKTITSINGISSESLLDSMVSLLSFERREMSLTCLSSSFGKLLFLLYGPCNTFSITLRNSQNTEEVNISGVSNEVIKENSNQDPNEKEAPYEFTINKEENYALLDFREFVDLSSFKKLIREMFEQIEINDVSKVIVDIRKNGGGNSWLTEEFASYITDKPFRQFSGTDFKVSKQIRKYYPVMMKHFTSFPMSLVPAKYLYRTPWEKGIGDIVSSEAKVKKHKPKQPFFTGRVIVLISAYTFSSATGFATAIKDNALGTIIGTPTGGFPSSHGDSFPFTLPNTYLQCGVSHKFFVRPNGNRTPEPLYPDFLIEETDPNAEIDRVLEYAINMK
ncbi:MAG: hypothetical protein KAR44_08650 [Candidatus Aegiribacteria sp.]|nr:hypothetical protein [Candidatus Aegiribacteria sp.]